MRDAHIREPSTVITQRYLSILRSVDGLSFCAIKSLRSSVLPDNAYLSLGKRLHFRVPTLAVIAVATSEVGPAVLLFVEEVCQVLRFQTNSVPRYQ